MLLLDEVFAVGDESFQRKCFGVIAAFKERGGTILFVSHDASAVERLCDRAVLLRGGGLAFDGPVHEAITRYRRALAEEDGTASPNGRGPRRLRRGADRDGAARGRRRRAARPVPRGGAVRARGRVTGSVAAPHAAPRGARRLRPPRRRGHRRDRGARLGRRARRPRAPPRRPGAAAPVRPLRRSRSRFSATTAACSTDCRAPSRCSSTRTARAAASSGSKERGGAERRRGRR